MSGASRRRLRLGVLMWLVQPVSLLTELIAAAVFRGPYSFLGNTISDLGATTCTTIDYPYGPVPVCSPAHLLVNSGFIVFGVLTAVGAVLLRPVLPRGAMTNLAVAAWGLTGVCAVATGLVPLDQDLVLHYLVSLPAFLAQPVAFVLTGLVLRRRWPRLGWTGVVLGMITVLAGVTLTVWVGNADTGGLLERLTLWPAYLWLPFVAYALGRAHVRSTEPPVQPSR